MARWLATMGSLASDRADEIALGLLLSGHRSVALQPATVFQALSRLGWNTEDPRTKVVLGWFGPDALDGMSVSMLALGTLRELWSQAVVSPHATSFTALVLDRIATRPDGRQ